MAGQTATIGTAAGAQLNLNNTLFANSIGGLDLVNNNSTVSGDHNLGTAGRRDPALLAQLTAWLRAHVGS